MHKTHRELVLMHWAKSAVPKSWSNITCDSRNNYMWQQNYLLKDSRNNTHKHGAGPGPQGGTSTQTTVHVNT